MQSLDRIKVEIAVVLGQRTMPIHHLLRMGRGAVIELDTSVNDEVEILANMKPIARGDVLVEGNKITVEVTNKYTQLDQIES